MFISAPASPLEMGIPQESNIARRSTMSAGGGAIVEVSVAAWSFCTARRRPSPSMNSASGVALSTCRTASTSQQDRELPERDRPIASRTALQSMRPTRPTMM